ncbi:MAG: hypothetical protein OIF38_16430 [Cellvibrionaceae bacterium]|nr:hypothetical protein [Cellvibrionaceae bacterium]
MFDDFEQQVAKFRCVGEEDSDYTDGLEYCHQVLGLMSDLAGKLALLAPVKPKMMVFDSANIIGGIECS